jgi:FG-GAP-like repeat/FG-GAP repeat
MIGRGDLLSAHPLAEFAAIVCSRSIAGKALRFCVPAVLSAALLWAQQPTLADFTQDGPKLVGAPATAGPQQGFSVALSADGHTAIVGGATDNGDVGAAWVFTRNGLAWRQQAKLVGTGAVGGAAQGRSVALSADGNTAIVGGYLDNNGIGAAWVFTRSGGVWTQQGMRLIGTGAVGNANQGWSVALSADGNTAIVGGYQDNGDGGAVWVFARTGGVWFQQGSKLVGTGAVGNASQGWSVALSADGNTAIVGGRTDNNNAGAAWVFTRSGATWNQLPGKLVGTPAIGAAQQGTSVALSGPGNTAIVGGPFDNFDNGGAGAAWVWINRGGFGWTQERKLVGTDASAQQQQGASVALSADGNTAIVGGPGFTPGAAWVFTRGISGWTQQGGKLVGTGAVGVAMEGFSAALACNTAIIGAPGDNSFLGAAWVFTAPAADTHDFSGDCLSDIVWRDTAGNVAIWLMDGGQVLSSGGFGAVPANWQIVGQRDFNGDGKYDLLWRDGTSGTVALWLLEGLQVFQSGSLGVVPTNWNIVGTSDFDRDGKGDILWRDGASGMVAIWLLNGLQVLQSGSIGTVPSNWVVAGTDGNGHILWRDNATGTVAIWVMNGLQVSQSVSLGAVPGNWLIVGAGDFNGAGTTSSDILWRDSTTGTVAIWLVNNGQVTQAAGLGTVPSNWSIALTGDFNGDGKTDILWRDSSTGAVVIWFMNGLQVSSTASVGAVGADWTIQGANAD